MRLTALFPPPPTPMTLIFAISESPIFAPPSGTCDILQLCSICFIIIYFIFYNTLKRFAIYIVYVPKILHYLFNLIKGAAKLASRYSTDNPLALTSFTILSASAAFFSISVPFFKWTDIPPLV